MESIISCWGTRENFRFHDLRPSPETAKGFDTDRTFMLVEIAGDEFKLLSLAKWRLSTAP
jgi:hypothetical protein